MQRIKMNVPSLIKTLVSALACDACGIVVMTSGKSIFITTNGPENQGRIIGKNGAVIRSLTAIAKESGYFLRLNQPHESTRDESGKHSSIEDCAKAIAAALFGGCEVEVDLESPEMIGFACARPEKVELVAAIEVALRCIGKKHSIEELPILWES